MDSDIVETSLVPLSSPRSATKNLVPALLLSEDSKIR
jgi:hypothetical protein